MELPWTYSGLLDDVIERYRIAPEVDDTFFQRSILRSVLFNGPILVNDGYLFHHSVGLKQVLDEDSLVRVMSRNGFIKVLSRGYSEGPEAILSVPENLAQRGVNTAKNLVSRSDWSEIKAGLEAWADSIFRKHNVAGWPALKMHVGMRLLFERCFEKSAEDLGITQKSKQLLDLLQEQLQNSSKYKDQYETAPRSAIEDALLHLEANGQAAREEVVEIINLANQAYHYNFGMCLENSFAQNVVTDTTIGPAFEDLLDLDQKFEIELESIPAISIPRGFPLDRPGMFDKLLDESSDLFKAKSNFINAIERATAPNRNTNLAHAQQEAKESVLEYRAKLKDHFGQFIKIEDFAPKRAAMISWFFSTLGGKLAVGASIASVAAKLAGPESSAFLQKWTKGQIDLRAIEVGLDPTAGEKKKFTYLIEDVRPRFSSVAFNEAIAKDHRSKVPKFEPS